MGYLYEGVSVLTQMMSVVGKSTCSGSKTGLYIFYHGGNAVRYIKERSYFLKDGRISGYFDTKFLKVLQIEQILHGSRRLNTAQTPTHEYFDISSWNIFRLEMPQQGNVFTIKVHLLGHCALVWGKKGVG